MAEQLTLSSQLGHAPTNHAASREVGYQPMVDHTTNIDKMPNNSTDSFDGYTFKTDWNGSTNYMRTNNGNLFAENYDDGLRLYTSESIGKDRRLYYQYWDRHNSNLWLPNVVGFTGFWRQNNRQYHPRLQMVCFHYMDATGARGGDFRPTETLFTHNENSHYFEYDNSGQHDSGSDWMIGYQLSASRRQTVFNSQMYLHGISLQFLFRTAAGSSVCDGRFWNWKPIIAKDANSVSKSNSSTCKSGKRLVIPARGNTYPITGDIKIT